MTVYNIRQRFMINYSSAADNSGLIRSERAPLWKLGEVEMRVGGRHGERVGAVSGERTTDRVENLNELATLSQALANNNNYP